jgi:hypothetical protein
VSGGVKRKFEDIEPAVANQKLHALGWNEVAIDYHCLQIAIACLEADTK